MNQLDKAILFYVMRYTEIGGEFVLTRTDVANFCGCTTPTAKKRIRNLVDAGLVIEHKKLIRTGAGYKYVYVRSENCPNVSSELWKACEIAYYDHVRQKTVEAVERALTISKPRGRTKKVSEEQLLLDT